MSGSAAVLSAEDVAAVTELCGLVDAGYARIRREMGSWPPGLGQVDLSFGNEIDRAEGGRVAVSVDLYGFVFGAGQEQFNSVGEALAATRRWHARVMARLCWRCAGEEQHDDDCPRADPGEVGS